MQGMGGASSSAGGRHLFCCPEKWRGYRGAGYEVRIAGPCKFRVLCPSERLFECVDVSRVQYERRRLREGVRYEEALAASRLRDHMLRKAARLDSARLSQVLQIVSRRLESAWPG